MCRNLPIGRFRRRKDVLDEMKQRHRVARRLGNRRLCSDPASSNEVNAIRSLVAGHGIDERQRLDRKPQARELTTQRLESLELVSQRRGSLGPSSTPSRNARARPSRSWYCCTVHPPTHGPKHFLTSKRMHPGVRGKN